MNKKNKKRLEIIGMTYGCITVMTILVEVLVYLGLSFTLWAWCPIDWIIVRGFAAAMILGFGTLIVMGLLSDNKLI